MLMRMMMMMEWEKKNSFDLSSSEHKFPLIAKSEKNTTKSASLKVKLKCWLKFTGFVVLPLHSSQ